MRISGVTYVSRKSNKAKHLMSIAILLILIAAITTALVSVYSGWRLAHPSVVSAQALNSGLTPEEIVFKDASKSVSLSGWYFQASNTDKAIILSHGYGKNRLQFKKQTADMIKALMDKGFSVLAFDFRNSGKSSRAVTSFGIYEKADLLGAISFAKSKGAKHIVLMGFSTGASTAILAAAESPDVEAVIADSPYADLDKLLSNELSAWSRLPSIPFNATISYSLKLLSGIKTKGASPENMLNRLAPRHVLFIHSRDDKLISVDNSRKLYKNYSRIAGDKAEFWETDNAPHAGSYTAYPTEYLKRISAFLDKVGATTGRP